MSSLNIPIWQASLIATGAISKGQAVGYDGDVAGAGEAIMGIALDDVAIGERIPINRMGLAAAVAGAVIAGAGVALQVGTTGRLITLAGGIAVARSSAAAAADDDIEVTLVSH